MRATDAVTRRVYVYIVSRKYPDLCRYLEEEFLDDPNVMVILDRRYGERRMGAVYDGRDRRRKDRRQRPNVDAELLIRSHAIVTIE